MSCTDDDRPDTVRPHARRTMRILGYASSVCRIRFTRLMDDTDVACADVARAHVYACASRAHASVPSWSGGCRCARTGRQYARVRRAMMPYGGSDSRTIDRPDTVRMQLRIRLVRARLRMRGCARACSYDRRYTVTRTDTRAVLHAYAGCGWIAICGCARARWVAGAVSCARAVARARFGYSQNKIIIINLRQNSK